AGRDLPAVERVAIGAHGVARDGAARDVTEGFRLQVHPRPGLPLLVGNRQIRHGRRMYPSAVPWAQNYDPLHNVVLSTAVAALPLVALLGLLASGRVPAHIAALVGLGLAMLVAIALIGMPAGMAIRSSLFGAAYGLFPIGWIILNVLFLYHLVQERGLFDVLQRSIT